MVIHGIHTTVRYWNQVTWSHLRSHNHAHNRTLYVVLIYNLRPLWIVVTFQFSIGQSTSQICHLFDELKNNVTQFTWAFLQGWINTQVHTRGLW